MRLFSEIDQKLENASNPAEFAALAYTKQQTVWDHWIGLKETG